MEAHPTANNRRLAILTLLACGLSLVNVLILLGQWTPRALAQPEDGAADAVATFDRIEARRLDLVDQAGVPRLTLGAPLPDPQINGEVFERRAPAFGMMLRDAQGDEVGGIGVVEAPGQVKARLFALDYDTAEAIGFALLNDTPQVLVLGPPAEDAQIGASGPLRILLGLDDAGLPALTLHDSQSRPRIRIRVGADDQPSIELLDEQGEVSRAFAQQQ